jgi:signal peptidase II
MTTLVTRWCVVLLLVASTVGCDVVTKRLAAEHLAGVPAQSFLGDTVRLSYAENAGGFLNLGATLPRWIRMTVFTVAVGAFLFLVAAAAWRHGWRRWHSVALSLLLAGGFCNWIDRLGDGIVIDFLNVGIGGLRTGIFNVADVAIMVGIALFLFAESRVSRGAAAELRP